MARREYGRENIGTSESRNGRTVKNGQEEKARRSQMPECRQQRWVGTPLMCRSEQAQHACNISIPPHGPAELLGLAHDAGLELLPVAPLDEHFVAL